MSTRNRRRSTSDGSIISSSSNASSRNKGSGKYSSRRKNSVTVRGASVLGEGGASLDCSPSVDGGNTVPRPMHTLQRNSSGIPIHDFRGSQRTAVLTLPDTISIDLTPRQTRNPMFNSDSGDAFRVEMGSIAPQPDGGIEMKDQSNRREEIDADFLSFSSSSSSPFHRASSSQVMQRDDILTNEGDHTNRDEEMYDSEYETDSASGSTTGKHFDGAT